MVMANNIKKKFPFVFEREVTLAEVDQVVRYLMTTQSFSSIDVIEKNLGTENEQLVLVAQLMRKINKISIEGNSALSDAAISGLLKIEEGATFERKELLTTADDLQTAYAKEGFFNPKIDIDFQTPNDGTVDVQVRIKEGMPCQVTEINIDTTNKSLALRAKRRSASLIRNRLSEEGLDYFRRDMESFFANNRYLSTRLSTPSIVFNADKSQAKITFAIENPNRYEFLFDGNSYFSAGQLIKSLDLDRLRGITTSPAADLSERIQKLYLSTGFAHAIVEYSEKFFEDNNLQRIKFKIVEGPRVRIRKIEITGNVSRPSDYYANFIRDTSSDLIALGYYNRRDIEDGYKNLVIQLQNEGFLRARVQSVRSEFSKKKDEAFVTVAMDEGPLTQIRQVRFTGATAFSKMQLENVMLVKTGEPLSLTKLEESLLKLKNYYHSAGYLEMRIQNEGEDLVTYNDTNTHANIDIQIEEGPKVLVASIVVQGNTFTKDYVILRELEFGVGDTLTPEKIEESVYKIQRLALFSQVEIKTLEEGTTQANRTAVVTVSERLPGLFYPGVGITNRYQVTYRGYVNFAYRNIAGTGRAVNLRLDLDYAQDPRFSYLENRVTFGYLEPFIFGTKNRGRLNLFREQSVLPPTANLPTKIREDLGIDLLLERDLNRHVRLTYVTWGFENQRRFDRTTRKTEETLNIGRTGPILEWDYRDDPFDTTAGTFTRAGLEYAHPILGSSRDETQTIEFVKATAAWTRFTRLFDSKRFVWINSLRGGYLNNVSKATNSGVPNSETFSLGGTSTIRGFDVQKDTDRIPNIFQLIPTDGTKDISKFQLTTESEFYLIKSEVRMPFYGPFSFAVFYDGGGVAINQPGVRIDDPYRDSWGFGFRVNTPAGPVSADIGFKLDRRSYFNQRIAVPKYEKEEPFALHFSIGNF